ncbi:MAG: PrsW family intramembrane metalloprotease [Phycisphaeraceae bacterium]
MFSYLVLTLGGLLFGAMVYRYDMHEREPWWMLVGAAVAGGLTMALAFKLEGWALRLAANSGMEYGYRFLHALLAGTLEEAAKLAVPLLVMLLIRKHFNDPMDGLIYGSLAGLGAALYEAGWYQFHDEPTQTAGWFYRAGTDAMRMFMHTIWGGIIGFPLGLAVMNKPWRLVLLRTAGLVMLIHFAWDLFVGFVQEQGNLEKLIATALLGASVVWYGLLVVRANKWSRSMHAPQSKQRLVGRIVRAIITRRLK